VWYSLDAEAAATSGQWIVACSNPSSCTRFAAAAHGRGGLGSGGRRVEVWMDRMGWLVGSVVGWRSHSPVCLLATERAGLAR